MKQKTVADIFKTYAGVRAVGYIPPMVRLFDTLDAEEGKKNRQNHHTSALVLNQLCYWSTTKNGKEFWKSDSDLQQELCMSERQVVKARKLIERLPEVKTRVSNFPRVRHYRINVEALARRLGAILGKKEGEQGGVTVPSPGEGTDTPTGEAIVTEITSEITSEICCCCKDQLRSATVTEPVSLKREEEHRGHIFVEHFRDHFNIAAKRLSKLQKFKDFNLRAFDIGTGLYELIPDDISGLWLDEARLVTLLDEIVDAFSGQDGKIKYGPMPYLRGIIQKKQRALIAASKLNPRTKLPEDFRENAADSIENYEYETIEELVDFLTDDFMEERPWEPREEIRSLFAKEVEKAQAENAA